MPEGGSTNDWRDILAERLDRGQKAEGAAVPARDEAVESGQDGLSASPVISHDTASLRKAAASLAPSEPATSREASAPEPAYRGTALEEGPAPPRPPPPMNAIPRPASGPRGHYTGTVHTGRPQPLDSLGPGYGDITTGWQVPATGGLPAADAGPRADSPARASPGAGPGVSATTGVISGGAAPERPAAKPSGGTSPELVVRKLTRQISAREEMRALNILRGETRSGLGLAAIMVLSSIAVFAGTYLWTQAARERGVLRTREDMRAPEETELAVEKTGPARDEARPPPPLRGKAGVGGDKRRHSPLPIPPSLKGRGDRPPGHRIAQETGRDPDRRSGPQAEVEPDAVTEAAPEWLSDAVSPVEQRPGGRGPAAALPEREDEDAPVFTISAPVPSSGEGSEARRREWVDLGGPLFE